MTISQFYRISGLGILIGAVAFVVHVVLRSLITAGLDPSIFAKQDLWVPINALGVVGAVLVLLGLPAMYARVAGPTGLVGLVGVVLIAVAWMFFGMFLSLYGVLVLPWLADKAPSLVAASAPLPVAFVIAFIVGLAAWFVGTVLLAIPFIRGRVQQCMLSDVQPPPEAFGPPAIVLDSAGVTAWLEGEPRFRVSWSQVESVSIEVMVNSDLNYSEAFWRLAGDGAEFAAPVEVIVNAEQLNQRLFALPGFDMVEYGRAREAEAQG